MMSGKVKNKHHGNIPKDAIYIGRGSKYGNPFIIGKDGDRSDVIRKYEVYLNELLDSNNITVHELADMYGFDLVCYCKPLPCHGDILLTYINVAYRLLYH